MSTGTAAMKMPLKPPTTNIDTNPMEFKSGTVNCRLPPHSVPSQLNVLTAEGRAIIIVETMNVMPSAGFMPLVNMWWPQTMKPSPAIAAIEYTMGRYPNSGLREKHEIMSETIPIAGRIMMYTAGCE